MVKRISKSLEEISNERIENIEVIGEVPVTKSTLSKVSDASKEILEITESAPTTFSSENLLNEEERRFYLNRRNTYLDEFNLNKSADLGIIHRIIMEEIITERLYKAMLENPGKDFSEQITESHERYRRALDSLGASRDKRIRNRETNSLSIADLAKTFCEGGRRESYSEIKETRDAEEEALMREKNHTLELEYGIIESERELPDGDDG